MMDVCGTDSFNDAILAYGHSQRFYKKLEIVMEITDFPALYPGICFGLRLLW